MIKVLVPTDFSSNSKAGMRFAINWAAQQEAELVFVHVLHLLRPTRWSDAYFNKYVADEEERCKTKFRKFVAGVYSHTKTPAGRHSLLIIQGNHPDTAILDYCRRNKDVQYICISTRGAGTFNKLLGTNTGNLIVKSNVPVIAVPKTYRVSQINNVLYATDLRNYSSEIKKVADFAQPLKARIQAVHFARARELELDNETIEAAFKTRFGYKIELQFQKISGVYSLVEELQEHITRKKPSVVIMFTNPVRSIFGRLLRPSNSEALAFDLKVPMLVFNKNSDGSATTNLKTKKSHDLRARSNLD
jgi:nucleotide-binding universal stress UspA family protein